MKFGSAQHFELVERRLELLRALLRSEAEWRRAFVAMNIDDSQRCSAAQEILCDQIRMLDREITAQQNGLQKPANPILPRVKLNPGEGLGIDPVSYRRTQAALEQMAALHLELKRANQTKRAILRRSKSTIDALHNLFNSYAPTYAAPAAHSVGTLYEERV